MEFALQVSGPYDRVLAAARFSEDNGLPAIALPDHYLGATSMEMARTTPAHDAFVQLAGLARDTHVIELMALVSPITFRHPAVLAKMAVTIDHMSGGRFSLGVGTGWFDLEHEIFGFPYPSTGERFELLEEALGYLRAAFDPDHPGFRGAHFVLEPFPLAPQPLDRIKLVVGGTGMDRTPRLAGRFADEFNAYPGQDMAERIATARRAAAEAGRDPDALFLSSAGHVVGAEDQAELDSILDERAARSGQTREELDAAIARRNSPIGTWDALHDQFAAMETAGIRRFYLQGVFDAQATPELLDRVKT